MPRIIDEWLGYCNREELVRKTGGIKKHNKWWAGCILQDDDGSCRIHTLYAAIGQKGSEHIERYDKQGNPLSLSDAHLIFDNLVKEKESAKKGYVQQQFGVSFGTPTQVTLPSFTLRFSTPSSALQQPSQTQSMRGVSPIICPHCATTHNSIQDEFCSNCGMDLTTVAPLTGAVTPQSTNGGGVPRIGPLPDRHHLNNARYIICSKVGEGGMGAVYKASDAAFTGRFVAIKEFVADPRLDSQQIAAANEAFRQEALLLAPLTHQSLPRIYDHFTEAGRSYLVMDFIEGETLESTLEQAPNGRLPVEKVLTIGIALCDVLDFLHTHTPPIIFRDLKPGNIMLTERGHVYLIDFGIARVFKFGQQKDTIALGSPGYAAPEQYGKSQSVPKTDLYGLGATLHHALTGCDPSVTPFHFAAFPKEVEVVAGLESLVLGMVKFTVQERRPANMARAKWMLQKIVAQQIAMRTMI